MQSLFPYVRYLYSKYGSWLFEPRQFEGRKHRETELVRF